jgi:hypothetical protein
VVPEWCQISRNHPGHNLTVISTRHLVSPLQMPFLGRAVFRVVPWLDLHAQGVNPTPQVFNTSSATNALDNAPPVGELTLFGCQTSLRLSVRLSSAAQLQACGDPFALETIRKDNGQTVTPIQLIAPSLAPEHDSLAYEEYRLHLFDLRVAFGGQKAKSSLYRPPP